MLVPNGLGSFCPHGSGSLAGALHVALSHSTWLRWRIGRVYRLFLYLVHGPAPEQNALVADIVFPNVLLGSAHACITETRLRPNTKKLQLILL